MNIVVKNLTKKYGLQKAVDDISFEVKTGEILGFLGPNGAGKTTTMKAITSFLAPNAGTIEVGGISVTKQPEEIKKYIGYLPESNPLYEEMPVIDYLRFVAELQDIPKARIAGRIIEMIRVCGIEGEKHKKIGELSKGYRQRVALAQALIHDPQVLILDEPTTGLDPNQIVEIRELIRNIGREKTVILSSHILAEVEATCDRIMIISKGKIVADGTPESLRKQATGREVLKLTIEDGERNEIYKGLQQIETVEVADFGKTRQSFDIQSKPGETSRRAIFELCKQNGWVLTEITPIETKLEDIFRELTLN
jgi:ABC-2 type transport system ATP-binding protein